MAMADDAGSVFTATDVAVEEVASSCVESVESMVQAVHARLAIRSIGNERFMRRGVEIRA